VHRHAQVATWLLLLLAVAPAAGPALAQSPAVSSPLRPGAVAALDVALYTAGANLREASDTSRAALATSVLRGDPRIRGIAGDQACYVIVACARAVGRDLNADWVVMAKVSKTSNLIWLLTGQLINVDTGEIVMDDSTELKGDPDAMIRAGVGIFAERVARTVKERASGQRAER
jgi:hypothetical protein